MKILVRIVIILAAALLVVGVTYAWAQAGGAQSLAFGREGRFGRDGFQPGAGQPPNFANGQRPFRGGGERGREGGSLFGLGEVLKDLLVVAGLSMAVAGLSTGWAALRKQFRRSPSPAKT